MKSIHLCLSVLFSASITSSFIGKILKFNLKIHGILGDIKLYFDLPVEFLGKVARNGLLSPLPPTFKKSLLANCGPDDMEDVQVQCRKCSVFSSARILRLISGVLNRN